jgi:hypothetical protein
MWIVLEGMGASFEDDDELEEYFAPIDLDGVSHSGLTHIIIGWTS